MKVIVLFSLIGVAFSLHYVKFKPTELIEDEGWQIWKAGQNKKYADFGEEKVRYAIWKDNFQRIRKYNEKSTNVVLAMNQFGDMTNTEFRATMNGFFPTKLNRTGSTFLKPSNVVLPASIDWRAHGYVTPVKNQGQCGSCWSFSTTGALEGQHFRKTGKLVSLSEQNLVDCSTSYGNHGCHGGMMDFAFKYIRDNGGIDTEESYPYQGEDLKCRFKSSSIGAEDTGFMDVPQGDEDALKAAIGVNGPVSVAIDASHFSFQFYKSGVYNEPACDPEKLDHGVLAVGYGTEEDGDYWIVKNSWGPSWGDGGFVLMSRNKDNQCGIASCASYPLV